MDEHSGQTPPTRALQKNSPGSSDQDTRLLTGSSPGFATETTGLFADSRPEKLGGFRLHAELGRGGMGVVYRATDEQLERKVALKVISPKYASEPSAVMRLREEARAAAQLVHQNIVSVYSFGEDQGLPFIAMEYVEGMDLSDYLRKVGLLDLQQALLFTRQAAEALCYAHERSVIHRDIKPSNIFISRTGQAKVMDFGLAKRLDMESNLTATGAVMGTPNYMAPEQALGTAVDHRADMYSLGCTLYTMLTGREPYKAESALQVMMKHIHDPLPIPKEWKNLLGGRFVEVLEKMTAKKADDRYQHWKDVVQALVHLEGGAPLRQQPPESSAARLRRQPALLGLALVVPLMIGLAIVYRSQSQKTAPAPVEQPLISASFATPAPTPVPTPAPAPSPTPLVLTVQPAEQPAVLQPAAEVRDQLNQAGIAYDRILQLSREGEFDQARQLLNQRNLSEEGGPLVRKLRERLDVFLENVELALKASMDYDAMLFGAAAGTPMPRGQRGNAALARVQATTQPERAEEVFQAMVYMHAIGDPRHSQAHEMLRQRFPQFHPTPIQHDLMEATRRFFGGGSARAPQRPHGGPNGALPPARRPRRQ